LIKKPHLGRVDVELPTALYDDIANQPDFEDDTRLKRLSAIRVIGFIRGRVSTFLKSLISTLLSGEDLFGAWEAARITADHVNITPVEQTFRLVCRHVGPGAECQEFLQVCQGCFSIVFWEDMRVHLDPIVDLCMCPVCYAESIDKDVNSFLAYPDTAHQAIAGIEGLNIFDASDSSTPARCTRHHNPMCDRRRAS
jgi:hypothetical protein